MSGLSQDERNRLAFMEEASDLLSELEQALLELEEAPDDQDLIDRVFRAMHTIKGSGAMFGFDDIAGFTHDVETVFDRVRSGELKVSKEILDATLLSRDHIAYLLECIRAGDHPDLSRGTALTARLKDLAGEAETEDAPAEKEEATEGATTTYRVRFKPNRDLMATGNNPVSLLDDLGELGVFLPIAHMESVPDLAALDPEECHLWWDGILTTTSDSREIEDVFMFVEDDCELLVQEIDSGAHSEYLAEGAEEAEAEAAYKKLGEILVERGDISADDLRSVLEQKKKLGDELVEKGMVGPAAVKSALAEQQAVRQARRERTVKAVAEPATSIRVAADKLDNLVDLVGELVIVQAQISQVVSQAHEPSLLALSEELERLSDELRDATLGIRMLPIGTTFSKFRRLVRDLSTELGKQIDLSTEGAETELDKTVIERLNDPLVHLLRNSIDHGVEIPAERTEQGKSPTGSILLSAEHSGGEVHIRIVDDGKGIDPAKIRAKAVERGLISQDADLSEKEIFNLIFLPGFSTASAVTNVSGRGVGMDVVKRAIESLRGSVEIDSVLGQGTSITVKLPLTLAIIDGLQVKVGEEFFVIPLPLVEECVELAASGDRETGKREQRVLDLRDEIVPYIRLRSWFQIPGTRPPIEQIVVVGAGGSRVGIVVDHVIGEHQTVIKSLGRVYRDVQGISGATIKGDGTMALILDVQKIIHGVAEESA